MFHCNILSVLYWTVFQATGCFADILSVLYRTVVSAYWMFRCHILRTLYWTVFQVTGCFADTSSVYYIEPCFMLLDVSLPHPQNTIYNCFRLLGVLPPHPQNIILKHVSGYWMFCCHILRTLYRIVLQVTGCFTAISWPTRRQACSWCFKLATEKTCLLYRQISRSVAVTFRLGQIIPKYLCYIWTYV
jgi:hypothetical protein